MRDESVTIQLFDGSAPFQVPTDQIDECSNYFAERERAFSRSRSQLTALFYGREFERLHESREREIKKALRKAGISFDPIDWPTADTQIRLRPDESVVERDSTDAALAALLPQWLEPFVLPSGSRDPLGLQAPAERLVNEVLPGLTVFTFRAGYYAFLTWAIREVNSLSRSELPTGMSRREALNRFERAFALCEFIYHGLNDSSCVLIGQRSKQRVLAQSNGDRYRVPDSILKNQNTAGSLRLFSTSLVSCGFVEEVEELTADALLPYRLTPLGQKLALAFAAQIQPGFVPFALGEASQSRDALRRWGQAFCFSRFPSLSRFRELLLTGLLMGGGRDAEKRYATVSQLLRHRLYKNNDQTHEDDSSLAEDDAAIGEAEPHGAGLISEDVILHFYECPAHESLQSLQALAVSELISLGLNAIFRAAVASVAEAGVADVANLSRSIATLEPMRSTWQRPMQETKPPSARKLVADLINSDSDTVKAASIGGALILRLMRDSLQRTVWDYLSNYAGEQTELVDRAVRSQMHRSLAEVLPDLFIALTERHAMVSQRKNRQRWLFAENGTLLRDDPQPMGMGVHALRFWQLGSLLRDMKISAEDLSV